MYYTPPPKECFEELKRKAMELWREIDTDNDKYGYASDKIARIKEIDNIRDNFMCIVGMFDIHNQRKLADKVSNETKKEVRLRLSDGGNPDYMLIGWI